MGGWDESHPPPSKKEKSKSLHCITGKTSGDSEHPPSPSEMLEWFIGISCLVNQPTGRFSPPLLLFHRSEQRWGAIKLSPVVSTSWGCQTENISGFAGAGELERKREREADGKPIIVISKDHWIIHAWHLIFLASRLGKQGCKRAGTWGAYFKLHHCQKYPSAQNFRVLVVQGYFWSQQQQAPHILSPSILSSFLKHPTFDPWISHSHSSSIPHLSSPICYQSPKQFLHCLWNLTLQLQGKYPGPDFSFTEAKAASSLESFFQRLIIIHYHPWLKKYISQLDWPFHHPATGACWNIFGDKLKFSCTQSRSSFPPEKKHLSAATDHYWVIFFGQVLSHKLWASRSPGLGVFGCIPTEKSLGTSSLLPTLHCSWKGCANPKTKKASFRHLIPSLPNADCWKTSPKLNPLHLKFPQILGAVPFPCPRPEHGHLREIFLHVWSQCCKFIIATNSLALIPEDMDGSFPEETSTQSRFDKILNIWQEQRHT